MKRIFRNKIKKKLSFRLNFDISHAVSMLREHHGVECWVGQELEQVRLLIGNFRPCGVHRQGAVLLTVPCNG